MKSVAYLAAAILAIALSVSVLSLEPKAEAALDAVARLSQLQPKVATALDQVEAIETNTTRTEAELGGLLNETRHIAIDERAAQSVQLAQVADVGHRVSVLLDDADVAVKALDTIPPVLSDGVRDVVADAHQTAIASQSLMAAATADLDDPAIMSSEAAIATATQQMAGVATDAHTETGILVAQTKKAFEPGNKFVSIFKAIVGGTLTASELWYYLSK